jgi:nucleoid DNA-binding protein
MTKRDIVIAISNKTGVKQITVKKIVQETFNTLLKSLCDGEKIEIRNFGVFKVKKRKSRIGRNPKTGDIIPVPERNNVVFKPGLEMKKRIH